MLKVIINSYACCPNMGSEPGMGWNWIIHLAKHCELYVITEGEFLPQIDAWFQEHGYEKISNSNHSCYMPDGSPSHSGEGRGEGLHFYWNPVTPEVRKMCWNQGDWRFYKYYEQWQRKTADIAINIFRTEKIDVLHQLNMIGFREPGYLWQVSKEMGIPFVWGPVDAKGAFPMVYALCAPLKNKAFLLVKNLITHLQLKYSRRVRNAVEQADLLLSASSESVKTFKRYYNVDSVLMNETGCFVTEKQVCEPEQKRDSTFNILWVGKFDFRKQLDLAIRVVAELKGLNVHLHIVGDGESSSYKELALSLGVEKFITWHGLISHSEVQRIMRDSSILLFTSVAEGTPHVVLEAIANSLPVVCLDTCGQGDCIDSTVGIKIPLSNPTQSVKDFADKITYLYNHPDELQRMSENCKARASELSWDNKVRKVVGMYEKLLAKR